MLSKDFRSELLFNSEDKAKAMVDLKNEVAFMERQGYQILDVDYFYHYPSRILKNFCTLNATIYYKI